MSYACRARDVVFSDGGSIPPTSTTNKKGRLARPFFICGVVWMRTVELRSSETVHKIAGSDFGQPNGWPRSASARRARLRMSRAIPPTSTNIQPKARCAGLFFYLYDLGFRKTERSPSQRAVTTAIETHPAFPG